MATAVKDIKSRDWQISTAGFGVVAEGIADIRQCLDIILRTARGSDPLRPEFGSNIYQYIDQPTPVAVPNMTRAIIEAVELWETRVEIVSIQTQVVQHHIHFFITYRLVDQELIETLRLLTRGGFVDVIEAEEGALILEAFFPPHAGKRLFIEFVGDDVAVLPTPPSDGFGSPAELFAWVNNNWPSYGRWVELVDRIVLYLRPNIFTTASLQITAKGLFKYVASIPALGANTHYVLNFVANGAAASPASITYNTIEEILQWVQGNWGVYGDWSIETGTPETAGDFDPLDFDQSEFDTGTAAGYNLVLFSETVSDAILDVLVEDN